MRKLSGVIAVASLGISLTWAAGQVDRWLGFQPRGNSGAEAEAPGTGAPPGTEASPGNGSIDPAGNDTLSPSGDAALGAEAAGADAPGPQPELSAEAASIEEDLARIEEALENEEVLEEFTPSERTPAEFEATWLTDT